jgi:serine/threonine-protein kinase
MIGTQIGHYKIIEEIGRGGMGVVYKGMDVSLERFVAIKVLSEDLASDQALMERFHTEAKAQARLSHANIATLHAFEQVGRTCVIVMEYLEGETFEQMIERRGPIPWEEAVPLFKQGLLGIGYAHRAGIIHRDIKPSNIMVARGGMVKVMDFGIAKVMGNQRMTRTGTRMGTLAYMSPEQIQNLPVDVRSDIYSLGVTLYQLLSGHVPFESDSEFKVMSDHVTTPPPSPTRFYPYIPDGIVGADLKALAKNAQERFQSCEEFGAALERPGAIAATQPQVPQVIYAPPQVSAQPQVAPPPPFPTAPQVVRPVAPPVAPQVAPQVSSEPRVVPVVATPLPPTAVKTQPPSRPAWLFAVIGGAFVVIALGVVLMVVGSMKGWFTHGNGGGGSGSGGASAYGNSGGSSSTGATSGSSAAQGGSASEEGSSGTASTGDNGLPTGIAGASNNASGGGNTAETSASEAGPVFVPWHILRPDSGSIYDIAFSPDGTRLASADNDSTVKLWSASTGQLLLTLAKHSKPVFGVAFNPDGSRLASASLDNNLYVWDASSGDPVLSAPTQFGLWTVAYSKDGRFLAAAGETTEVDVWNVKTQAFTATLHATGKSISRVDFSPDGNLLVAGGDDGVVHVWNVAQGSRFEDMKGLLGHIGTSRFSPGGKYVVSGDTQGVIMLWAVQAGTPSPLRTYTSDDNSPINDVIFTPDGKYLISAHASHAIRIWDIQSGTLVRTLSGHTDAVNGLSITHDGRILASSSGDGTIRLWQLSSGQ